LGFEVTEPGDVRIREFRESDLSSVRKLIHHTINVCYTGVYPARVLQFFKNFHSDRGIRERAEEGDMVVMERAAEVIGTGGIVGNHIYGVFVEPMFQRRGYGKAIMRELETRAQLGGHREVVLDVSLPSREFYDGLGYEVFEEACLDVGEGQHLDFWKAKKALRGKNNHLFV
jgi:ribosomal protein S18 acetylase RimI-like enzyme